MPVKTKKTTAKKKSKTTVTRKTATKKPAKKKPVTKKAAVKKSAPKKTTLKSKAKKTITPKKVTEKTVKKAVQKKSSSTKKVSKTSKKKVSSRKKYNDVKKILESRKEEILKEVAGDLSSGLNLESVAYPDLSDLASIESNRNFEIRIKERERKLLKKINIALEQIENGTFGICESCGEEIGSKRLLARPVATLCIQCKTEAEREEKTRNV